MAVSKYLSSQVSFKRDVIICSMYRNDVVHTVYCIPFIKICMDALHRLVSGEKCTVFVDHKTLLKSKPAMRELFGPLLVNYF